MHPIEEAFGEGCSLYTDVLKCSKDANDAQLRKAYYRAALQYHPDKNPEGHSQFQAISMAYQILKDKDLRGAYDETGEIPDNKDDDDDDDSDTKGNPWKNYFDRIFGKVTTSGIDAFAAKYKCSDEEKRDVLREYGKRKGNLVKMLEFVMLSTEKDAVRWVEDYLRPALKEKEISKDFESTMEKSLQTVKKKLEKEQQKKKQEDENETTEEESTESEDDIPAILRRPKKATATKAKPTKAKKQQLSKKKKDDMTDLISQIRNKRRGGNVLNDLAARYGGKDDDEDPLSDEAFAKTQARLQKKRKSR